MHWSWENGITDGGRGGPMGGAEFIGNSFKEGGPIKYWKKDPSGFGRIRTYTVTKFWFRWMTFYSGITTTLRFHFLHINITQYLILVYRPRKGVLKYIQNSFETLFH